jgi:Suppressor of fused protein (SUFU)
LAGSKVLSPATLLHHVPLNDPPNNRAEVRAHIERHLGPVRESFCEGDDSRIEILHIPPQDKRPVRTLITCGMSDRPMNVPSGTNAPRYIELMMTLPRTWPLDDEARQDVQWNWPLQQLRSIAEMPQTEDRWVGWGETISNGNPPRPLAPSTKFCGAVIVPSLLVPPDFYELKIAAHSIQFFSVLPLFAEELALKDAKGTNHLFDKLLDADVRDFVDLKRRNVAKKRFGLF